MRKRLLFMKFKSIKIKLLIIFLLVGFVPAITIGIFSVSTITKELKQQLSKHLIDLAEAKEGQVFAYLDSIESRTVDFASDGFITDSLKKITNNDEADEVIDALNTHLIKNKKSLDETLVGISVMDINGEIVASTDSKEIGKNESHDSYFIGGKKDVFISEFENYDHFGAKHAFIVAAPLVDRDTKKVIGVITNVFTTEKLQNILSGQLQLEKGALTANLGQEETLEVYITNKKKEMFVVPETNIHEDTSAMKVDTLPVQKCLENKEEVVGIYSNYADVEVIGASMCIPKRSWTLIVEISTAQAFLPITLAYTRMEIGTAIFIILIGIFALIISHTISRPIEKLREGTEIIAKGNLDYRVNIKTNDEIEQLGSAFNTMTRKLKRSYSVLEKKVKERTKDLALSKREVEKEKEKFEAILKNIGDGICVIDKNEKILVLNKAAEALFNQKSSNIIGEKMWKFFQCHKKIYQECMRWQQGDVMNLDNVYLRAAHKQIIPISFNITPIKEVKDGIKTAVITFRDLTEEKKIDKMKSELIAVASHHLRTPLTAMRWQLEMLTEDVLKKSQIEIVEKALSAHSVMLDLVNDLLHVSEIEAGKFKLAPEKLYLEDVIVGVVKNMKKSAVKNNIRLAVPKFGKKLPQVYVDREKIRDVIRILIENAIKYCEKGKKVIISYKRGPDKKSVIFSVKDEGIGIPLNVQKYIFSKFYRTPHGKIGAGLKLFLAKNIITGSNGDIWFESEEGKGSTFYFRLPVYD